MILPEQLAKLRERHRPVWYNRFGRPTTVPEYAWTTRCEACHAIVDAAGCPTWVELGKPWPYKAQAIRQRRLRSTP